ncbi:MAG: S1 RNA-binding domain-containing protein [Lachnospiraceae bacterium]|nr:S1 RNA-binding domain-containing protein [Lachnospiraceae bacterium]
MSEELRDAIETPVDNAAPEEAVAAAPAETMDDYQNELNNSMRRIEVGDLVEGTVTGISDDDVTVDLSYYAEGIIRKLDYSGDPNFSLKNDVKIGDPVKAIVLRTDDGRGNILLSRRNAMEKLAWEEFKAMKENKQDTEVKIVEVVKGGVVGFLNGIRAFVPASQLSLDYVEDLSVFKGQVIPVRVITAEQEGKKLVLSSRDILRARRNAEKAERISNIQVGLVTEGTVQSLMNYGAFVNLGSGIDGLVHISQISSEKRLKHPSEALAVGDKVKVKVTAVKDGKISLSMKALDEAAPAKPVEEERVVLPKSEKLTTSLGSLLSGIKLN